jgi:Uncharacterized lipoprotein
MIGTGARLLAAVAFSLALAGCSTLRSSCHDPAPYTEAKSIPPLRIPPGLEAPDTRGALRIPELNEPAPPPRKRGDKCLDEPPPYSTPKPVPPQA